MNPAIIAGSKNERLNIALEEFWLELAENVVDLAPWHSATSYNGSDSYYSQYYQQTSMSLRHTLTFYSSAGYGNNIMLRRVGCRSSR